VLIAACLTAAAGACGADGAWPPAPRMPAVAEDQVGELPPSIQATPRGAGIWSVRFSYKPDAAVDSVHLAGTFNAWNGGGLAMSGPDEGGAWSAEIQLGAGDYQYKFVRNRTQWVPDPLNPQRVDDGHSGFNSVLYVGRLAAMTESTATRGDGKIDALGVLHRPQLAKYRQPLGDARFMVRYRTFAHDVEGVQAVLKDGPELDLHPVLENELFTYWEGRLDATSTRVAGDDCTYTFVITDGSTRLSDSADFTVSRSATTDFHTPAWARDAIWYQIMPDRFRNGDPAADPDPVVPWTMDWFSAAPWEGQDGQTFYKWYVFDRLYGGDIEGLEQKLPYLKSLGVNALYFNPVFQAESHHKYNATNYLHVDDLLGGGSDYEAISATEDLTDPSTWKWTEADKRFLKFLNAAKAAGFRVILDGVWNHVGIRHPAFQDVRKNGKDSKYADWFEIESWEPFKHVGWAGFDSLPVFRKSADGLASAGAKKHIFDVTRRWMDPDGDGDPRDGIDGWRLDVPNEIALPFWYEWRDVVKSVNPDAYITGEIWDRADAWLDGRAFDAVMNYEFARVAVAWIGHRKERITPSQADARLAELRMAYAPQATYVLQNLVDSHDTDRLASMMRNPDRTFDRMNRVQDDNPAYDNDKPSDAEYARARLIALLQMTYVGAPMVYYGDEVGMWGADDPTCRKPMLWEDLQPYEKPEQNHVMKDHLEFYRRAIALRNAHPALRTGDFQTLLTDDKHHVWAFERFDDAERLIVVLNAGDTQRNVSVPLATGAPQAWKQVFGDDGGATVQGGKLSVRVGPMAGVVLRAGAK